MSIRRVIQKILCSICVGTAFLAAMNFAVGIPMVRMALAAKGDQGKKGHNHGNGGSKDQNTKTPIQHVIVIIGENRTFDHIFATYQPRHGETISNLLWKGIVNADGTPGPNFPKAHQNSACDVGAGGVCPNSGKVSTGEPFEINPDDKALYDVLPAPLAGGPADVCTNNSNCLDTTHCMCAPSDATSSENGLDPDYYQFLLKGGTGLTSKTPDTRIKNVNDLLPGPFQLTSSTFPYYGYAASPVHRFYQMWQQFDCDAANATSWNPSGCLADLFPWVEVTVGAGTNGKPQPANFSTEWSPSATTTGEGSTSMGFYNMQQGDAPYFKFLADRYSMSDNFHQSVMGGTGANHIMLGYGDAIWFSDGNGNPAIPPHNVEVFSGTPNAGVVDEIEDPNPQADTNNWYTEDGYGGGGFGKPVFGGGSYTNCADTSQPGVTAVVGYLNSLPRKIDPNCETNHYYLLNNYNPGYFGDGSNAYTDHNVNNTPFTIPPSSVRNIGDTLLAAKVSWKYYGDQYNQYLTDKYQQNYGAVGPTSDQYCNICNFFQYSTSMMTNPSVLANNLKDTTDFYNDVKNGTLPAVSFVKPSGWVDGHPASSTLILFEGFVKKIVDAVQDNPKLWASTAILITFDEGGGYYDSGYVEPLDYFGDGTRIPLMVVSPWTKRGHISHTYTDHVSILKFIEYNWGLAPVTSRSRDNFPNPVTSSSNPYVPLNTPAIGDLTDQFDFKHGHGH
jgi:phospholipase C